MAKDPDWVDHANVAANAVPTAELKSINSKMHSVFCPEMSTITEPFMHNCRLNLALILSLSVVLFAGCSKAIVDGVSGESRKLPATGAVAHFIGKDEWHPTSEAAAGELMKHPDARMLATLPLEQERQMTATMLAQNVARLKAEGRMIYVPPGSKVRVLGYYTSDGHGDQFRMRPLLPEETWAQWANVQMLEGEASGKTCFVVVDGIAD